jgi:hypothetical protein
MKLTNKQKFNKKYGFSLNTAHSKDEIAKITKLNRKLLDSVYDSALRDFKEFDSSIKKKITPQQYAHSKVYEFSYFNGSLKK